MVVKRASMYSRSPKFPADRGRSREDINRLAVGTRLSLGFAHLESISAMECMYRLRALKVPVAGRELPVVYNVKALEPGVKGETVYDAEHARLEILLEEETYSRLEDPAGEDPHARFSFFHELGHAILHGAELMRLSRIPRSQADAFMRARFKTVPAYRDVEWQANTFSASIMMPLTALAVLEAQENLSVEVLCRIFGVSRASAEIRLQVFREEWQK